MANNDRKVVETVKGEGDYANKAVAKLFSDGTILLIDVRVSYPHFEAKWAKKPTDTAAYSGTFILPNETHKPARELCLRQAQLQLDERNKGKAIKPDAMFIRDGDQSGKDEYAGAWIVAARESGEGK